MRITGRLRVSFIRIRITRPRIRMRTSGPTYVFYILFLSVKNNGLASWQKKVFKKVLVAQAKTLNRKQSMKRIGNLYDKIISVENLKLADERARKGKQNSYGVQVHDRNRDDNIRNLHKKLSNKTFKTSKYVTFRIFEPKERLIYRLPYYPDRIVHHAVMNILEPIWVSIFTSDTFSCIKGRGIHKAREKVLSAIRDRESVRFCLKIDIRKFYPSIQHDVLKNIIRRKIKCQDTLLLLDEIIDSVDGVPIGNYLSQYFANLMLTYFDHWIKEVKHVKYYFRYADDMVFFSNDKSKLHRLLQDIKKYLFDLKLDLKGNYQIFPLSHTHRDRSGRGLDFVGYVFYLNEIRMRKGIKKNLCRATCAANRLYSYSDKKYKQAISSWLGWVKYSDSDYLLNKITYGKIKSLL